MTAESRPVFRRRRSLSSEVHVNAPRNAGADHHLAIHANTAPPSSRPSRVIPPGASAAPQVRHFAASKPALGGGIDRGAASIQQHRQGLAFATAAGSPPPRSRHRLTSGTDRIERVGLRAVAARRPLRVVQLDDDLRGLQQVPAQASAVPAGPLDRPGPQGGVVVRELNKLEGPDLGGQLVLGSPASRPFDTESHMPVSGCVRTLLLGDSHAAARAPKSSLMGPST